MCQIIHKPRNFTIPSKLIESTCLVNPDGFGYLMWDGESKSLIMEKIFDGNQNDPDVINRVLEKMHDYEAFLHFRFRTKGNVDIESVHPFLCFEDEDNKLYLMHNGTLNEWGNEKVVDSKDFGENFVGPLYEKFLKGGVSNPLGDKTFFKIIDKFVGTSSKVALINEKGNYCLYNKKDWYDQKTGNVDWKVSNTYSFNRAHREPYSSNNTGASSYGGGSSNVGFTPFGRGGVVREGQSFSSKGTNDSSVIPITAPKIKKEKPSKIPERKVKACYWKDVLGLSCIEELWNMSFKDIDELVDTSPEDAKLLINDLLIALFEEYEPGVGHVDEEVRVGGIG